MGTQSICGTEEEMRAELQPSTMGLEFIASTNCSTSAGLPAGTQCNVVSGPGIDIETMQAKALTPPSRLTAGARKRMDDKIALAERNLTTMILGVIIGSAFLTFFFVCLLLSS